MDHFLTASLPIENLVIAALRSLVANEFHARVFLPLVVHEYSYRCELILQKDRTVAKIFPIP